MANYHTQRTILEITGRGKMEWEEGSGRGRKEWEEGEGREGERAKGGDGGGDRVIEEMELE